MDTNRRLRLLREEDVAELLDVPRATLATWRSRCSDKLPYVKVGRSVRYRVEDVEAFLNAQTRRWTGDEGAEAA